MSNNTKEIDIGEEILKAIEKSVEAGVNSGIERGMRAIEKNRVEYLKNTSDRRRYNAEILLKNYKKFKEHIDKSVYSSEHIDEECVYVYEDNYFIDLMENTIDDGYIKSIIASITKTKILLKQIDLFLNYYFIICEKSDKESIKRRAKIIQYLYTDNETLTFEEIADKLDISTKTVNRDRKVAIQELAILFFRN